jgi:SAM-dependent methyltransferase
MDASYALGRVEKMHLNYRYRVRAQVAHDAFVGHVGAPPEAPRVLEMGAAEGRTLLHLRELLGRPGGDYVGVEYADDLIAAAPPLPPGARLIKGDVMDLPDELEGASFDLVTCLAVLEHLPDPAACVAEAWRVLRPGGVFVATCPNPFWDQIAGTFGMVADEHHEVEVTGAYMVELARSAGFARARFRPFMWVFTGVLPYLRVDLDPALSLRVDEAIARLGVLDFSFVNQALVAIK